MICRVKHIDNRDKKVSGLSKGMFEVGEVVKGDDEKVLSKMGVAVSEVEYDKIAKEKGTVPFRKIAKAKK